MEFSESSTDSQLDITSRRDKLLLAELKNHRNQETLCKENFSKEDWWKSEKQANKTTQQNNKVRSCLRVTKSHKTTQPGKGPKTFRGRIINKLVEDTYQGRVMLKSGEEMMEADKTRTNMVNAGEDNRITFTLPLDFYLPVQPRDRAMKRRWSDYLRKRVRAIRRKVNRNLHLSL